MAGKRKGQETLTGTNVLLGFQQEAGDFVAVLLAVAEVADVGPVGSAVGSLFYAMVKVGVGYFFGKPLLYRIVI